MVSMHGIVSKFSGKFLSIAVAIELQEIFRALLLLPNYDLELVSSLERHLYKKMTTPKLPDVRGGISVLPLHRTRYVLHLCLRIHLFIPLAIPLGLPSRSGTFDAHRISMASLFAPMAHAKRSL